MVWTYVLTNTGNITLTNITVTDDRLGVVADCLGASLGISQSLECEATGTAVTSQYANSAWVTATPLLGEDVSASDDSHYFGINPTIDIEKATSTP